MKKQLSFVPTPEMHELIIKSMQDYWGQKEIDQDMIEKCAKTRSIYLNNKGGETKAESSDRAFLYVPTGHYYGVAEIYISLLYNGKNYVSTFVSTAEKLIKRLYTHTNQFTTIELSQLNRTCTKLGIPQFNIIAAVDTITTVNGLRYMPSVISDIYKIAIMPTSIIGINDYEWIKDAIELRITRARNQLMNNTEGTGYTVSSNGEYIAVNTGFVNKMLNPIIIIAGCKQRKVMETIELLTPANAEAYCLVNVVTDKLLSVKDFFGEMDIQRVKLNATAITNSGDNNIYHALISRAHRFPAAISSLPPDVLCSMLITSIEKAVKMANYNNNYISPMYYPTANSISYTVPLHLLRSINEMPELFGLFMEKSNVWNLVTVLEPREAIINIKSFAPYQETISYKWDIPEKDESV